MTKILMVCLGNICRSPLAEGILKSKLSNAFIVDSAGTANYHTGNPPDIRSIKVARKYGLNISNLKGRQFNVSDFEAFDFIYVMDESYYQILSSIQHHNKHMLKNSYTFGSIIQSM